jgi:hypothetical protein
MLKYHLQVSQVHELSAIFSISFRCVFRNAFDKFNFFQTTAGHFFSGKSQNVHPHFVSGFSSVFKTTNAFTNSPIVGSGFQLPLLPPPPDASLKYFPRVPPCVLRFDNIIGATYKPKSIGIFFARSPLRYHSPIKHFLPFLLMQISRNKEGKPFLKPIDLER